MKCWVKSDKFLDLYIWKCYGRYPDKKCVLLAWNIKSFIYIPVIKSPVYTKYSDWKHKDIECEDVAYTAIELPFDKKMEYTKPWVYPMRVVLTPFSLTADILTLPFQFLSALAVGTAMKGIH